jgi:branched-chain amino acid transport system ATP-binding protein
VLAGYGEFMILNNLSFKAQRGKITLLLGPNGAGKSTVLKTLFGLLKVRQGRVRLEGKDITGSSAKQLLTEHGMAFVPQGRNLFGQLTVHENLELGGITLGMKTTRERIPEVLDLFPRVKERLHSAGLVAVRRRAEAAGGRPSAAAAAQGAADRRAQASVCRRWWWPTCSACCAKLADEQGVTVLMVEQNVKSALKMADDAIALESGRLVLHRAADELLADPNIERLFLGGAHAPAPAAA